MTYQNLMICLEAIDLIRGFADNYRQEVSVNLCGVMVRGKFLLINAS